MKQYSTVCIASLAEEKTFIEFAEITRNEFNGSVDDVQIVISAYYKPTSADQKILLEAYREKEEVWICFCFNKDDNLSKKIVKCSIENLFIFHNVGGRPAYTVTLKGK
jgi:hypothetical protein